MNKYLKLLVLGLIPALSFSYVEEKMPADLEQVADVAAKQYQSLHKLQETVDASAHRSGVQWMEVFDEKGFVIAHSHPSRVYQRKPLTQPHYNAVMSVLHSGHPLIQKGAGAVLEAYYPVKFHRKTVGVIEVVSASD
jgi:Single cache domain 3